jgi:hypothetical protein
MRLVGRARELGIVRSSLDRPEAAVHRISGLSGVGKTSLIQAAARDFPFVYHRVPPLPDLGQRHELAATLRTSLGALGEAQVEIPSEPSWSDLLGAPLQLPPQGRPLVLVFDDAHRFGEARSRVAPAIQQVLHRARDMGRALHVVLVSPEKTAVPEEFEGTDTVVPPLSFRAAGPLLPGASAADRLRSYSVFGGVPAHLMRLDPGASPSTNLRRAILDPGAPLGDAGLILLERTVQTPSRYVAVLSALAGGEGSWRTVHEGVPDLTRSGQVAPYLNRLVDLGLVEIRRSLDARPSTRSRRYRITDPFFAFWYRFMLGGRASVAAGDTVALMAEGIRPHLEEHLSTVLTQVCRQYMRQDAMELLGSNARTCGSLWGPGYDIPVAGILSSGAPFYGLPVGASEEEGVFATLDADIRETRYGFGRERRLRLAFASREFGPSALREAARRHDAVLIGPRQLAGDD